MSFPNQDVTDSGNTSTLLLSNALAAGITNAGKLSQMALLQEVVSNILVNNPPAWVFTTTGSVTGGAATFTSVVAAGLIKSNTAAGGVGYAAGAGTLVTQASNKTTAVVATGVCGQILTSNAELLPGAEAAFTVTNTSVAATDVVIVNAGGAASTGKYGCWANNIAANAFDITLSNLSAVSLTEIVTVSFAVVKAVNA